MFTIIKRGAIIGALVFASWIAVLSLVMVMTDAAPGAIALFPSKDFVQNLPKNAGVVDAGSFWVGIRSDQPQLGRALYRAGAWLVLPAGLPGCLPLPTQDAHHN